MDLVKKIVANLVQNTSIQRLALLDCHGYDAFPALAAMEVALVANHGHQSIASYVSHSA